MKVDVLVAEIGSTTTVVNAFTDLDSDRPCFFAQGQAPTSVLDGDVRIGLQGAIDDLCKKKGIDHLEYDQMLATSSAAGGLKMTVHGLVYDMTAKAAKEAALGAGGIIHDITVGRLRRTDLKRIKEINPNLILIAGGVDYGERDTAIYNAEMIRSLGLKTPVVYAGNIENQEEMKLIIEEKTNEIKRQSKTNENYLHNIQELEQSRKELYDFSERQKDKFNALIDEKNNQIEQLKNEMLKYEGVYDAKSIKSRYSDEPIVKQLKYHARKVYNAGYAVPPKTVVVIKHERE